MKKELVILASGKGSNAERILEYFSDNERVSVSCIITNRSKAGVIDVAKRAGVGLRIIPRPDVERGALLQFLDELKPDLIILAGFLLKIPKTLVTRFPDQIVNIHPSLLPKYGGKGMYGEHVLNKTLENKDSTAGITIHMVNEEYDKGRVIAQYSCEISEHETLSSLKEKIHALEHTYFPKVINELLHDT